MTTANDFPTYPNLYAAVRRLFEAYDKDPYLVVRDNADDWNIIELLSSLDGEEEQGEFVVSSGQIWSLDENGYHDQLLLEVVEEEQQEEQADDHKLFMNPATGSVAPLAEWEEDFRTMSAEEWGSDTFEGAGLIEVREQFLVWHITPAPMIFNTLEQAQEYLREQGLAFVGYDDVRNNTRYLTERWAHADLPDDTDLDDYYGGDVPCIVPEIEKV